METIVSFVRTQPRQRYLIFVNFYHTYIHFARPLQFYKFIFYKFIILQNYKFTIL
jgi:hypothetical protein